VQDHARGGCRDDLRDRGEVVDGFSGNRRRCGVVSEMPEALVRDQLSLMGDGDGCAGESALVNAGAQNVKGTLELFILMLE
jgi:hypothetical protein